MSEYLLPNSHLSVKDQQQIFRIRSQINPIPANKGGVSLCETGCGELLTNSHIIECLKLNNGNAHKYDTLINGNIIQMKEMLQIWNSNNVKRELMVSPDSVL